MTTNGAAPAPEETPAAAPFDDLKALCVLSVYSGLCGHAGPNITQQMIELSKQVSVGLFVELVSLMPQVAPEHHDALTQAYLDAARNIIAKNGLLQSADRLVSRGGNEKGACRIIAEYALATLAAFDNTLRQASQGTTQQAQPPGFPSTLQQQHRSQVQGQGSPMEQLMANLGLGGRR
jgi:hypothetical protein